MPVRNSDFIDVLLTRPLLQLAGILAGNRNGKEATFGAMTYGGVHSGRKAHYIGLCAEIAVAHYFNEDVDAETYAKGDNGTDIIVRGHKIAVKSTTYVRDPFLRVEKEHFQDDTLYFCCAVQLPHVFLCGYAAANEVKNGDQRQLVGNGPVNYVLAMKDLTPFRA